jgi:hypothetical protein
MQEHSENSVNQTFHILEWHIFWTDLFIYIALGKWAASKLKKDGLVCTYLLNIIWLFSFCRNAEEIIFSLFLFAYIYHTCTSIYIKRGMCLCVYMCVLAGTKQIWQAMQATRIRLWSRLHSSCIKYFAKYLFWAYQDYKFLHSVNTLIIEYLQ